MQRNTSFAHSPDATLFERGSGPIYDARGERLAPRMLGLLMPTDPIWVETVERDLGALLSDHAHCELKAAQSALSIVGRYGGEHPELVEPLTGLAAEETEHLRLVHEKLREQDHPLGIPASDAYVGELRKAARDGAAPPLLDRLLVCALIEARSCERFKLLAERLRSAALRVFYRDLMASEARHYRLFGKLAEECFGASEARARLRTLSEREGALAARLPLGATVHG